MSPQRFIISIQTVNELSRWATLLPVLETLLPVKFRFAGGEQPVSGEDVFTAHQGLAVPNQEKSLSRFSAATPEVDPGAENLRELQVQFSGDLNVPFPFRGRSISTRVNAHLVPLSLRANEMVLASCSLGPVWAFSEIGEEKHFRSAFPLPDFGADAGLQDVLNGYRFLEVLPLIQWLRELSKTDLYDGPPLRACFIFDDPNLHWPTYGFVDYKEIASRAQKENYHVSFATIPLDGWFTHRKTSELFRQNEKWLSLSFHGNNHARQELGRVYSEVERSFLLRQAVKRIQSLEQRTGLSVSRVMIPPHGACSEQMLAALPIFGFEAACISHGSLRHHNKLSGWTKALGFRPSEFVLGCPVLPRWPFTGELHNTILVAAYLGQAIILRGHHQDLKEGGAEVLDEMARFINGLGSVQWLNLADMARSNYQLRSQGDFCQIRSFSRKLICPLPPGVSQLQVETVDELPTDWRISLPDGSAFNFPSEQIVNVKADSSVSLEMKAPVPVEAKSHADSVNPLLFLRRILTEGRDRLQPMRS